MHTPDKSTVTTRSKASAALALSTALAASFVAQTASAQTTAAPAAPADDAVQLSAFTVSTDRDNGYKASNSIAGTRSNTPIKDIPLNIQVFTKDLSEDLNITSQIELERYNASLVNGNADVHSDNLIQQAYNGFIFRGFVQNWGLRDGVREYDPIDSQGLARVEIVKGPAAALYGVTYPGGVMNSVSKEVDFKKNFTSLHATTGTYSDYRGTIDSNYSGATAGGGKVGVRFNGTHAKTADQRDNSDGTVEYTQVNFAWAPVAATKISFLAENGYRAKANGLGYFTMGETSNGYTDGTALGNGADIPLQIVHPEISWDTNWATGSNKRSAKTSLYKATLSQAIGDDLSFSAYWQTGNRKNIDSDGWDASGGGGSGASWDAMSGSGWIRTASAEYVRMGYHYRHWMNTMHAYGATGVYKFDVADMKNTFTFGAHAWDEKFNTQKWTQPSTTTQGINFAVRSGVNTYRPATPPTDYYADTASWGTEHSSNNYIFAGWQMSALENRLRTNIGINRTNISKIVGTAPAVESAKTSPMIGALFAVTKDVSIFAVHSTSLFPTTDKNSFLQQMPDTVGKSYEAGVKVELMEGKVSGTISYYQITQTGGSQDDATAFNFNQRTWDSLSPTDRLTAFPGKTRADLAGDKVPGQEQESKGFEADLIFQPTTNWQVLLSYANNNQETTKAVNKASIGQSTGGHIKDQLAMLSKYTFTEGGAKGLSLGLGLQHSGKALQGYVGNGIARYNPSTMYVETFATYKFKAGGCDQSVQLNVKNLTQQAEFVGWKATGSASRFATERYEVDTKMRVTLTYGIDL